MGRRGAIIAAILVLVQFSAACGGISPSGQAPAKPTEAPKAAAQPTEAAKPAASPAAAQPSAPLPPIRGSGEVIVNGYASEYEDLFNRIIKEPFERETGIRVV